MVRGSDARPRQKQDHRGKRKNGGMVLPAEENADDGKGHTVTARKRIEVEILRSGREALSEMAGAYAGQPRLG